MSRSIPLSRKYGVNPTMPVCFWCGEETGEIALMGKMSADDIEAPRHMVLNYEPCEKCKARMAMGVTIMEATQEPNEVTSMEFQKGVYPTGRYVVISKDGAERIGIKVNKVFFDSECFDALVRSFSE